MIVLLINIEYKKLFFLVGNDLFVSFVIIFLDDVFVNFVDFSFSKVLFYLISYIEIKILDFFFLFNNLKGFERGYDLIYLFFV